MKSIASRFQNMPSVMKLHQKGTIKRNNTTENSICYGLSTQHEYFRMPCIACKPRLKRGMFSFMPKSSEILVGIQKKRSISVPSNRNICDHLWRCSTGFDWSDRSFRNLPFYFDKLVHCPTSLHLRKK